MNVNAIVDDDGRSMVVDARRHATRIKLASNSTRRHYECGSCRKHADSKLIVDWYRHVDDVRFNLTIRIGTANIAAVSISGEEARHLLIVGSLYKSYS